MTPDETKFNSQEFDFAYPPGIEHHYWTISRNFLLMRAIRQAGLQNESILEIGCGKGLVVAALRANNFKCWGAELANVNPVAEAASYVKFNTDAATLDNTFRDQVTVLMFLDVIEHIEHPVAFLQNILVHYPQTKHVIITVPARQEIWSNYDMFYRHFRRYNLDMVHQTLQPLNFRIHYNSYLFHLLYGTARLKFLFSCKRPVVLHAPTGFQKPVHRFIGKLLILESLLLSRQLPGSSILCIGSKNN